VTQNVAIHSGPAAGVMRSHCRSSSVCRCAAKNSRRHHQISIGESDTARGPEQRGLEAEKIYLKFEWRLEIDGDGY
jgi:hypothetical protein